VDDESEEEEEEDRDDSELEDKNEKSGGDDDESEKNEEEKDNFRVDEDKPGDNDSSSSSSDDSSSDDSSDDDAPKKRKGIDAVPAFVDNIDHTSDRHPDGGDNGTDERNELALEISATLLDANQASGLTVPPLDRKRKTLESKQPAAKPKRLRRTITNSS
jgi:hypothetical protein